MEVDAINLPVPEKLQAKLASYGAVALAVADKQAG